MRSASPRFLIRVSSGTTGIELFGPPFCVHIRPFAQSHFDARLPKVGAVALLPPSPKSAHPKYNAGWSEIGNGAASDELASLAPASDEPAASEGSCGDNCDGDPLDSDSSGHDRFLTR